MYRKLILERSRIVPFGTTDLDTVWDRLYIPALITESTHTLSFPLPISPSLYILSLFHLNPPSFLSLLLIKFVFITIFHSVRKKIVFNSPFLPHNAGWKKYCSFCVYIVPTNRKFSLCKIHDTYILW